MWPRLVLTAVALATLACGGGQTPTSPTPQPQPPPPSTLAITCPTGVVGSTTGAAAAVTYATPTISGGVAPVTITCSPFSGASFPVGVTTVACQATDARNTAAACSFPVIVHRVPTLILTRFLAFGDSVTSGEVTVPVTNAFGDGLGWGTQIVMPAASYPTQLRTMLAERYTAQTAAIEVTNAGISGEAAEDGARRFPVVMASIRPQVVLLLSGYNDLNTYGAAGVSRAISAIDTMAREARNRGARVYLGALTPSRPGQRSINPDAIQEFNARLRALANREGAVYVDLHAAFQSSVNTYVGVDGLHPTEAGYRRIAETFMTAIRTTLEDARTTTP